MPKARCADRLSGASSTPLVARQRFVDLVVGVKGGAAAKMRHRKVWPQPNRRQIVRVRLVVARLVLQDGAQVVMRVGVVGVQLQGLLVAGDRLIGFLLKLQHTAQVELGVADVRFTAQDAAKTGLGLR